MSTFAPYPFQRHVAALLLSGQSVILQAPTGAGKTFAALLPFFEARQQGLDFPRKCIYAVPMRVLANQFAAEEPPLPLRVAIQTGEHRDDPQFTADITFATIDQVLSSFLLAPYSLPRRLANLNAGAIASSYLVFDEFHLFEPTAMLPTTLEMLRMLRGVVPFMLMTATFSRDMLHGLAEILGATVVPGTTQERQAMQSLECQQKTRRYHLAAEPLSAGAVLARHHQCTLVICNTVARAQFLYNSLMDHPQRGDTQVRLLHSQFLPQDRTHKEQEIRQVYAKKSAIEGNWITIATQVVEVGLDITCENLLTELAPANAILQRAGRCARYAQEQGDVHIFGRSLAVDGSEVDLVEKHMPYQGQKTECESTKHHLTAVNGQALDFDAEQTLVSLVHGPHDQRMIKGIRGTLEAHRRQMNRVLRGDRSASASQLIRQVSSQAVVIHDDPNTVAESPFAYESFSLHTGSVQGMVRKWLERVNDADPDSFGVYVLQDNGDEDESGRSFYTPLRVTNVKDIAGAPLVIVHPALATYDSQIGFLPDKAGSYVAQLGAREANAQRERYGYQLEPYQVHAELAWQATRDLWAELDYTARHLEARNRWRSGLLRELAEWIALLHDTGKLSRGWQGWVRGYQAAIGQPVAQGSYAHTDYDPTNPQHDLAAKQQGRRPSHAVESAVAVAPLLIPFGDIPAKAAFTAIARHHGPFTEAFTLYQLERQTSQIIGALLEQYQNYQAPAQLVPTADPQDRQFDPARFWIDPQLNREFVAYALLARALRLADQRATAAGSHPS